MSFEPLHLPPDGLDAPPLVIVVGQGTVVIDAPEPVPQDGHFLGLLHGRPAWAIDDPSAPGDHLMMLWSAVDELTWTLAGRAVQLVEWARTHRFCGRCGTPTEPAGGERAMRCPACSLLAFPRLAPAVITLVTRDDGCALLARGRSFGMPMYSCLAGFVEPGETLEQAVHREVAEEVGIRLRSVQYWGSQPWPFPHSLMVGFTASYESGELVLDESEIVDANWYRPDDLPNIPPGMSIARRLIDDWLARSV